MRNKKIIISGGGTGGHLFPAVAVAQALKRIDPTIEILFVGAKGKIEEHKVPELGFKIELIDIRGFERKLSIETFKNIFRLIGALCKSRQIIRKFNPDVAAGFGGYASGPALYAASLKGVPTIIQEQNSYPGITNKILAKKASKICIAYDAVKKYFPKDKTVFTGNPVREKVAETEATKEEARNFFNIKTDKKVILVLGGSGGAKSINEGMKANLEKFAQSNFHVIWQSGKNYYKDALESVQKINASNIKVYDFISRMDLTYKVADLVVSRAGAGTISELTLLGKAVILVPSPNVAEDHQMKNAMALVDKNAAVLLKDHETKEKTFTTIYDLINNEEAMSKLSENISKEKTSNSDMLIAKEILKLIKNN